MGARLEDEACHEDISIGIGRGMCFFVLCNRHRFNRVPDPPPRDRLGVTYLPFTISSDAGYADLPLALLGAPVDIGALIKPGRIDNKYQSTI
jgi:hypothetical protein